MDRLVALPGCLVGSWRGIPFHVPDVSTEAGRRIVTTALPGLDTTIHEDLGLHTGRIRVTAMMVGDDVADRAAELAAACEQKGPGTLVHPWLGAMTAVLVEPADIRFEAARLRTVIAQLGFERWFGSTDVSGGLATLADIASAVDDLMAVVGEGLDLVIDLIDPVAMLDAVYGDVVDALGETIAGADLATILGEVGFEAMAEAVSDAAGAAAWVEALVGAIAAAGVPPASPAIGAGPLGRASEASVDPWATVSALLATASRLATTSLTSDDEGAALTEIATAVAALGAATDPLAAVEWNSRQQAMVARAEVSAAIATVAGAVVGATGATDTTRPNRRAMWRALAALRRTVHQDLDDRIGRLPSVMTISPPVRVGAWIVAQHLFGDDPKTVRSGFEDIVRRNRLAHPSICDVDPIEVLPQ